MFRTLFRPFLLAPLFILACASAFCQERLRTMPRYEQFERMNREIPGSVARGDLQVTWDPTSKLVYYVKGGTYYAFDLTQNKEIQAKPPVGSTVGNIERRPRPERGRQYSTENSPDGHLKAYDRDRNVYISDESGKNEVAVTKDGSEASRIKYGTASWVYGEELGVRDAMWWSPRLHDARLLSLR